MSRRRSLYLFAAVASILLTEGIGIPASGQDKVPAKSDLKTLRDRASYAIGINIGRSMKQQGVDISLELIARGLKDGMAGDKALLTDQEAEEAMEQFQQDMASKAADKGKREGAAFLAANGKKPDVKTTPSGLQYKILKTGTGPKPSATDVVTTHYVGTLLNGTEFDSSVKRNEPAVFPLNKVIAGWTEALQLMPVGSKWQLFVPPSLAYGEEGRPPVIAPNSTLIFEVELLKIGKPQAEESVLPRVKVK